MARSGRLEPDAKRESSLSSDSLAGSIKQELYDAEFDGQAMTQKATGLLFGCKAVLYAASALKAQEGG